MWRLTRSTSAMTSRRRDPAPARPSACIEGLEAASERRASRDGRSWVARWRENDRQRSRSFALKRDADAFDRDVKRRRQLGPLAVRSSPSAAARRSISGSSSGGRRSMRRRWRRRHGSGMRAATSCTFSRGWGRCRSGIERGDVAGVAGPRLEAGVTPATIQKARVVLSSILRHAAESEAIHANPLSLVRAVKSEQRDAVDRFPRRGRAPPRDDRRGDADPGP